MHDAALILHLQNSFFHGCMNHHDFKLNHANLLYYI
jgi:hypothetical protein